MRDLTTPAGREAALATIEPDAAASHHDMLREIFRAEADARRAGGDHEHFENLYWCAFLLFCVGDPVDVPMMWEAKHIDFDTGSGFDVQFLLGAGLEATADHLVEVGRGDIAADLDEYPEAREDLGEWLAFRRRYFAVSDES